MKDFSYITNSHPSFIEGMYQQFLNDANSVDPDLKKFFEGFDFAMQNGAVSTSATTTASAHSIASSNADWANEIKVYRLILGYRNKGHLIATTNPIRTRKDRGANLDLAFFGLTDADLEKTFNVGSIIGLGATSLKNILAHLQQTYASHVGIEFKYISDQKRIDFLTNEMENNFSKPISIDQKKNILEKLNQGVIFEKFLHTK
jgi:2-oxoglutarate dehydrogenase E1 component